VYCTECTNVDNENVMPDYMGAVYHHNLANVAGNLSTLLTDLYI